MEYMAAQMDRQIEGAISENERLSNEAEYYRAAVEQRMPRVVPARVRLSKHVRGDFPIGHTTVAEIGDYDCQSNAWGALSVCAGNGKMLGIKPAEFDPIAWRLNEAAMQAR